jgi:predicted amidophosphoribosyltransferase
MGLYHPSRGDPDSVGWSDLLSKHIRGLKLYPGYAGPLGLGLTLCIKSLFTDLRTMDLIVPVPKFKTEMKISADGTRKKYNQTMELAKIVSVKTEIPRAIGLKKVRAQKMKDLSEEERWAAVIGLYTINDNFNARDKNIILLDDVFTTGATLSECSSTLIKNGAKNVKVLVAGRDCGD